MEECLKAARVIHQIVIVAATAMLVFAMSASRPESKYTKALAELRELEAAISEIEQTAIKDVESRYAELHNHPRYKIEVEVIGSLESMYSERTVRDIGAALLQIAENTLRVPNVLTMYEGLVEQMGAPCVETVSIQIDTVSADIRVQCELDAFIFSQELYHWFPRTTSTTVELLKRKGLIVDRQGPRRGEHIREALPALRKVWDGVAGLEAVSASAALDRMVREEAQASSPKLSVLGLEMKATTAIVAGPTILIGLLLYLYAHLLHIQAIATGNEGLLREFPWLPLFDSRLSLGLTLATLWLLPFVAAVWTVWVAGLNSGPRIALALGYAAGLGLAAFVCVHKIGELNRLPAAALPSARPQQGGHSIGP